MVTVEGLPRIFAIAAVSVLGVFVLGVAAIGWRYGGGEHFEDLTTAPLLPATALEGVADLDLPPGNIAVSDTGRIFFSRHPEASPPVQMAALVHGEARSGRGRSPRPSAGRSGWPTGPA